MIDREKLAQELILRENIRKAIKIVQRKRTSARLNELKDERRLRGVIRSLLSEGQSAVASVAKHDSTGINALEDLLKNTNVLSVIETGYKSLTTKDDDDPEEGQTKQRRSYENHILSAVGKSLAPEESRKEAGEDVEITEDIDIDVGDRPEDDPDFIDVADEEVEEADPKEEFGLNGEDKTGRNRAFTDFADIEKVILTAFDDLDNPSDMAMFEEYLIKNLALYFEKYENELAGNVDAPAAALDAAADVGVDVEAEQGSGETDIPEFTLEEVIKHLNIDDIIENLL
jgi:hypothetical protein